MFNQWPWLERDIWLDCWCVKAWSCGVYLEFIIIFISTPSGCAITSRMLMQAFTVVFVLSGVCVASSSYYMQVPCLFKKNKKKTKRKDKEKILLSYPLSFHVQVPVWKKKNSFDCLKSASSIYLCHCCFILFCNVAMLLKVFSQRILFFLLSEATWTNIFSWVL